MCRNEIIIMMERERVLSWPELCLTGSWPALPLATLYDLEQLRLDKVASQKNVTIY